MARNAGRLAEDEREATNPPRGRSEHDARDALAGDACRWRGDTDVESSRASAAAASWTAASRERAPADDDRIVELVRELTPILDAILREHGVRCRADREDLIQQAALALVERWADIRNAPAWMLEVTHHLAISWIRRDAVRHRQAADVAGVFGRWIESAAPPCPEQIYMAREIARRQLEELDLRESQFLFRIVLGAPAERSAGDADPRAAAAMRSRRYRLREKLRSAVGGQQPPSTTRHKPGASVRQP